MLKFQINIQGHLGTTSKGLSTVFENDRGYSGGWRAVEFLNFDDELAQAHELILIVSKRHVLRVKGRRLRQIKRMKELISGGTEGRRGTLGGGALLGDTWFVGLLRGAGQELLAVHFSHRRRLGTGLDRTGRAP